MKWRNEQLYHLRQTQPLTRKDQELYFSKVINNLFHQKEPDQILFSLIENDICVGYGGLVHINWVDHNAEISFLMNTSVEEERFVELWNTFLILIQKVAFEDLQFHKIYTYAFDLRPKLYLALEKANFKFDARLQEHCKFGNHYIDVIIHSKINKLISA